MKLLSKMSIIFDHIIDSFAFLAGVLIVVIMFLMTLEAFMRYFFLIGLAWVAEICEYMLFLIGFFGAAWLLKKQGHVNVDFVLQFLNPKAKALLNMITSAMGGIVCLIITWSSVEAAIEHVQASIDVVKSLSIPKAPFLFILSLGAFMLSIQFLRNAYDYMTVWRENKVN